MTKTRPVIVLVLLPIVFEVASSQGPSNVFCSNYTPKGYDPAIAPETSTKVEVEDAIRSITKLDEVGGFMELQLYTIIKWKDARLFEGFDERFKDFELSSDMVELPAHSLSCIWSGMVHFDELLGGEMFDTDLCYPYVELMPANKMVRVIARYRIQILCKFEFYNYPMDSQQCTIILKPRLRSNYYLVWANSSRLFDVDKFTVSTFKLVEMKKGSSTDSYKRKTLKLTLKFQRRVATALIAIYFPSTLIVFISFVSFWVDSLAVPGRVTLVITSLLALMTQLVAVRDKATPVSYVTALDIWFFACLAFVSCALFEFALSYNFAVQRDTISLISSSDVGDGKVEKSTLCRWMRRTKRNVRLHFIPAPGLDGICRFLFPTLFIIFAVGYWIYYGLAECKRIETTDNN